MNITDLARKLRAHEKAFDALPWQDRSAVAVEFVEEQIRLRGLLDEALAAPAPWSAESAARDARDTNLRGIVFDALHACDVPLEDGQAVLDRWDETHPASLAAARQREQQLTQALDDACDVAVWMSGSPSFSPEGEAHAGWADVMRPKLWAALAVLAGEAPPTAPPPFHSLLDEDDLAVMAEDALESGSAKNADSAPDGEETCLLCHAPRRAVVAAVEARLTPCSPKWRVRDECLWRQTEAGPGVPGSPTAPRPEAPEEQTGAPDGEVASQ